MQSKEAREEANEKTVQDYRSKTHLSRGEFVLRAAIAATFIGVSVAAGGFAAGYFLKDDVTDDLAQKGANEMGPAIGDNIGPAVDEATDQLKIALGEEVDGVAADVRADIQVQVSDEVDQMKEDIFQVFVEYGLVDAEDVATVAGGDCPAIRVDCIGQN